MVGTILSMIGSVKKGDAQAAADRYNATQANAEAWQNYNQTNRAVASANINEQQQLGSVRAAYGASGVRMNGSAQDVIGSQAGIMSSKIAGILSEGNFKTQQLNAQAAQDISAANEAQTAGWLGAGGQLAETGEKIGLAAAGRR